MVDLTFSQKSEPVRSREIWQNSSVSRRDFAMKKFKFAEEQIEFAFRQAETGTKVDKVCRKIGVAEGRLLFFSMQDILI